MTDPDIPQPPDLAEVPDAPDVPDEIVRSIRIAADAQTVFDIVSEPGWFINDGEYREHQVVSDGTTARVTDPVLGQFEVGIVALEPPHRAVFCWLGGDAGSLADAPRNTVTFTVEPSEDGVVLTVHETGFASLDADAVDRRRRFEEHSAGWVEELAVAREQSLVRAGHRG
ncbi:MAG: SRPBCC domain-containing protein [Brevibacterium yomogidense]|uniref:SRPBCC domain-containing protein n=1 Tax=Brevibacterium sp. Mu109 TaxID=1255669 RepID=UPI000C4FB9D2|nr:SRPBCC domain-containing protein [Brevibacterium sp. Mu109]SMX83137.1 Uncharacterized conserved protein YndB, AHSA1/START domain [Brevibacterium sp. Mu109]